MTGYTKLFSSILMSSIWEESMETRLVWVTMLALADQHGHVDGTVKSLARVSRVTIEQCQRALDCLLGPDGDDRSGVLDGRRLVPQQGGWGLVNHATYRNKMSADDRRERDRIRKRNARMSAPRPLVSENVRDFQQAEAEADTEANTKAEAGRAAARGVQGIGAAEAGSLPRDHMRHAACGPRFLICLSPAQYAKLAPRFNAGTDAANRAGVEFFLGYAEGLVGPNQSPGDFVWLLQHYDAWLAAQGRIPAAPAKVNGKPQPRTAAQIIASMKAEGSL